MVPLTASVRMAFVMVGLFLASSAAAQTDPCAAPPPSAVLQSSTGIPGFCHDQKDADGVSTILNYAKVFIDSSLVYTWTTTAPAGLSFLSGPWTGGTYYYEAPAVPVPRGTHVLTIVVGNTNDGDSVPGTGFSFQVKGKPPKAPIFTRIRTSTIWRWGGRGR